MDDLLNVLAIRNLENHEMINRPNNLRNPVNPFISLNDRQFIKMFRLSKELCRYVIECVEPYMRPQKRETDLAVGTRVLTALKFYGTGSYQPDIGANKFLDVAQSSVSVAIKEVTEALNNEGIFNEWVCFPNTLANLTKIRAEFHRQHQFPGVVGCIDCTHVALVPPNAEDPEYPEHVYVNRKNYHSINVQLICDANLKILNVNARYPGSTNDSFIWNQSNVQQAFRNLHAAGHKDYFLLGDSGYPLRTWLFTPYLEAEPNSPEATYNELHKKTRVKIECCNGVLKSRFRCLLKHRTLHYKPIVVCKIINACVVLHNMCREYNVPDIDDDEGNDDIDFGMDDDNIENEHVTRALNPELHEGKVARNKIASTLHRR